MWLADPTAVEEYEWGLPTVHIPRVDIKSPINIVFCHGPSPSIYPYLTSSTFPNQYRGTEPGASTLVRQ